MDCCGSCAVIVRVFASSKDLHKLATRPSTQSAHQSQVKVLPFHIINYYQRYSTGQKDCSITCAFHACKDAILQVISTQLHANYMHKNTRLKKRVNNEASQLKVNFNNKQMQICSASRKVNFQIVFVTPQPRCISFLCKIKHKQLLILRLNNKPLHFHKLLFPGIL